MDVELNRGRNNNPSSVPITVISPSTLLESYKKKIYPTGSESNRCLFWIHSQVCLSLLFLMDAVDEGPSVSGPVQLRKRWIV